MATSAAAREKGNEDFRAGRFTTALQHYSDAVNLASGHTAAVAISSLAPEARADCVSALLNRAACSLRIGAYQNAVADCSVVIDAVPGHAKALFRRAQAFRGVARLKDAIADVTRCLQVDSKNEDAQKMLRELRAAIVAGSGSNPSSLPFSACMEVVGELLSGSIDTESADRVLAVLPSLSRALRDPAHARTFLLNGGAATVLQAGAALHFPDTKFLVCFTALFRDVAMDAKFGAAWASEWSSGWAAPDSEHQVSAADGGAVAAVDLSLPPSIVNVVTCLGSCLRDCLLPLLRRPGAPAAVRDEAFRACGGLLAACAVLVSTLEAQQSAALFHASRKVEAAQMKAAAALARTAGKTDCADPKPSSSSLCRIRLPACIRAPLVALAEFVGRDVLASSAAGGRVASQRPPSSAPSSAVAGVAWDYSPHEAALRAVAQLVALGGEDGVRILHEAGVLYQAVRLSVALPAEVPVSLGGSCASSVAAAAAADFRRRVQALYSDSATRVRRTAIGAISRCLVVLRDAHAPGYVEAGKAKVRALARSLLAHAGIDALAAALPYAPAPPEGSQPGADGSVAAESALFAVPRADWSANEGTAAATALLGSCLLVDRQEGLTLTETVGGWLPAVLVLSGSPNAVWQVVACDVLSALTNDETGRGLLSSLPDRIAAPALAVNPDARLRLGITHQLSRLVEARAASVRSSASVMLAKLASPAKAFTSDAARSNAEGMVLSVFDQLEAATHFYTGSGGAAVAKSVAPPGASPAKAAAASATFVGMLRREEDAARAPAASAVDAATLRLSGVGDIELPAAAPREPVAAGSGDDDDYGSAPDFDDESLPVDVEAAAKAIEALAVLSTHTRTKTMLVTTPTALVALMRVGSAVAHAQGVTAAQVLGQQSSAAAARSRSGEAAYSAQAGTADLRSTAFGIAFIVYSLTVSRSRQREEKVADMEMDMKQYRQMQKLLAPGKLPGEGGGEDDEEVDPPSQVAQRVRALVAADTIPLLSALAAGARLSAASVAAAVAAHMSANAADSAASGGSSGPAPAAGSGIGEMVSRALLNLAEVVEARGPMVARGAVSLLLGLQQQLPQRGGGAFNSPAGVMCAAQALARILISTHPSLIPAEHQMDALPGLLLCVRDGTTSLQQFECLLALTNVLGSGGEEARQALLDRGGLESLEHAQFSDHALIRRAGTEALTNLAGTDRGAHLIAQSRPALWLSLARSYCRGAGGLAVEAAAPNAIVAGTAASGGAASSDAAGADAAAVPDEGEDTPTALAAAGAVAMALLHLTGQADAEEGEKDEEQAAAEARLSAATRAAVRASRDARAAARRAAAESAVHSLVDAGAASAVAELLLCGNAALQHRALVIAGELSKYPRGVAALLSSPIVAGEEEAAADYGATPAAAPAVAGPAVVPTAAAAGSAVVAPAAGAAVLTMLLLLADGKDPAALSIAGSASSSPSSRPSSRPLAAPLQPLAAAVVQRILRATESAAAWAKVLAAADARAKEEKNAPLAAGLAAPTAAAAAAAGPEETSAAAAAAAHGGAGVGGVEGEEAAARAGLPSRELQLRPERPSAAFLRRHLAPV